MTKKIFVHGYYGVGNIGDNMLLEAVVNDLNNIFIDPLITIPCEDKRLLPNVNVKTVRFKGNSRNKARYLISLVWFYLNIYRTHDVILFGGGTQIFDNSKYSWKPMMVTSLLLIGNKILFRRKVIHYGVGIGALDTKLGKFFTKIIAGLSDAFILRDKQSCNKLEDLRVEHRKYHQSRDLSYRLSFETRAKKSEDRYKVGFSLFDYFEHTKPDKAKSLKFNTEAINVIRHLINEKDAQVYLFSCQKNYGNKDEEYSYLLQSIIGDERVIVVDFNNDWKVMARQMNDMNLCIGMRYHFLLLSLKLNIPSIAISYSIKVEEEFRMFDLDEFTIKLEDIDLAEITEKMTLLETKHDIVENKIAEGNNIAKNASLLSYKFIEKNII